MSRLEFLGLELPEESRVVALRGQEGISELYAFEVWLDLPLEAAADLDLDEALGRRGTIRVASHPTAVESHAYHGIVREIELVHAARRHALLRLVLAPELHRLTHSRHSRVFTSTTSDAVLRDVLDRAGLAASSTVSANEAHPEEEHVVQYRESDERFVARWMEREGFVYWFRHGETREELVVTDTSSDAIEFGLVRYHASAGEDGSGGEALVAFRALAIAGPRSVRVHDYDHARPSLSIVGEGSAGGEDGVIVRHEDRAFSPDEASRLARIRAEASAAHRQRFVGRGTVFGVRPGMVIELRDHPRPELDRKYLVTRVEHRASEAHELLDLVGLALPRGYEVVLTCVPAELPYRTIPTTPWPRVHGHQLGLVDGPADGDYAQLDDAGCYLVKLFFDESDLSGDSVSTRIRMMQPHAGSPEGFHFPLRKGTEVVVQFTGGDPDRPVIAGAVPDAKNPSVVTEANSTQNVLQTGGLTRIEIEDEAGKQFVWIRTPPKDSYLNLGYPTHASHHVTLHTRGDGLFSFGSNQLVEVGGVLDERVSGDVKETYHSNQTSTVTGPQTTTVTNDVVETYCATQTTKVSGAPRKETFLDGQKTLALGPRSETYGASQSQSVHGTTDEFWVGPWTRTSGATTEDHFGDLTEVVSGPSVELCPSGVQENYGDVTAVWASLLWVGSTIHYTVPNSSETHLYRSETVGCDFKNIDPTVSNWKNTSFGTAGLKLEVLNFYVGATAVKLEMNEINLAYNDQKWEPGGIALTMTGFYFCAAGVTLKCP